MFRATHELHLTNIPKTRLSGLLPVVAARDVTRRPSWDQPFTRRGFEQVPFEVG